MKEYKESIRHSCGHTEEYVTSCKLQRRLVHAKRLTDCPKCQLKFILQVEKNRSEKQRIPPGAFDEYDEQW